MNGYYYNLPVPNVTCIIRGVLPGEMFMCSRKGKLNFRMVDIKSYNQKAYVFFFGWTLKD